MISFLLFQHTTHEFFSYGSWIFFIITKVWSCLVYTMKYELTNTNETFIIDSDYEYRGPHKHAWWLMC